MLICWKGVHGAELVHPSVVLKARGSEMVARRCVLGMCVGYVCRVCV
jgi:hypothetical protein